MSKLPASATKNLGENIRRAREAMNLSQVAFGVRLGYKKGDANGFISLVESGKRVPKVNTLLKIARVLGTSLEALLAK